MCPALHESTSASAARIATSGTAMQTRSKPNRKHHHHHHHRHAHTEQALASRSREDLLEFVRERREDKERAILELEQDAEEGKTADERFRIRPPTPEVNAEAPSLMEVRAKSAHMSRDGFGPCPVCLRGSGVDGFPCRVCGCAFHRHCLLRVAHLQQAELDEQLRRAHTNIGWSCPTCDDISSLLTENELNDMMEDFDNYDINKGITLKDYVAIKKADYERKEGHAIGELDLLRVKAQFQCMDINGDGMIVWWEFVRQETCKKLAKRPRETMMSLLTDKEVSTAYQLFCIFDDDNDGQISEYAIRKAYRSWYSRLTASTSGAAPRARSASSMERPLDNTNDPVLDLHVEHHCRIVLGESEDNKCGVLTWEDFIMEQALYIICSRPNRALACHTTHLQP